MADIAGLLAEHVGAQHVLSGESLPPDYAHDEALGLVHQTPAYVVRPESAEQVAAVLGVAAEHGVPVTARGSGTGLSGAAIPREGGIVVSFERMNAVLEIDTENHVAVVQPGVTLTELEETTAAVGLVYPVYPGELTREPRRQHRHQRRWHAGGQVRRDPPPRARVAGRPALRRDHPHRRQVREGQHRLRPHPAHRRVGRARWRWSPRRPSSSSRA